MMDCPQCHCDWNPLGKCPTCGYELKYTLDNPSIYQAQEKWPKHGLLYDGTRTIVAPRQWGPRHASQFIDTVDITSTIQTVAVSGATLYPHGSDRDESYIFYFGSLVGDGGPLGQYSDFYAVRIVNPHDMGRIHFFPDDIRSIVDKEIVCSQCGRAYVVATRPENCQCGMRLIW